MCGVRGDCGGRSGPACPQTLTDAVPHCVERLVTTYTKEQFPDVTRFSNYYQRHLPLSIPVLSGNRIIKQRIVKCLPLCFRRKS